MSFLSTQWANICRIFYPMEAAAPPDASTTQLPPCSYILGNETSDTFDLPDGRKLGYAQYGSPTGRPILYMHGLPGSRIEASAFHDQGLRYNARLIAVDRPGYGWSSPQPNRTILGFTRDVELLAEHLGLEEYFVMGISGGGPYALACGLALPPDKLKAVALICGLGPPDIGMKGADWWHWIGFTFGWRWSPLFLIKLWLQSEPAGRLDWSDEKRFELMKKSVEKSQRTMHPKDLEVFQNDDFLQLFLRTARQTFAQGFEAALQDGCLMASDFGFRIEDIRSDLPFQLWYGKEDCHVPPIHGEQISARLDGRATLRMEDETHASIYKNWKDEYIRSLVQSQ